MVTSSLSALVALLDSLSAMRLYSSLTASLDWLRTLLRNSYFWWGLGGLLLLGAATYLIVDAVIMPSYTSHGVAVRVPNVESRSFEDAKELVQDRDLMVKRQVGRYNPNVDRGTVVDQNPPPRSDVKPGRRVYLTVNAGTAPVVNVPNLNGISVREAKNRVSSHGLNVGTIAADSIPSPYPNTITRQRPSPGDSLKQGGTVDLWYSTGLGADTVRVPNVVGYTVQESQRRLLQRELRSVIVDPRSQKSASSSSEPDSTATRFVQRQGRSPDAQVRTGTEIRLFTTTDSTQVPSPEAARRDSSTFGD